MRKILILLAGASLIFGAACGGDDDDDAATDSSADASGGSDTENPLAGADGYNDEIEANFLSQCAPAATGVADPEGMCQCAWDKIVETVPYEEFVAYDEALRSGDTSAAPPAGLMDATTTCATEAATGTP